MCRYIFINIHSFLNMCIECNFVVTLFSYTQLIGGCEYESMIFHVLTYSTAQTTNTGSRRAHMYYTTMLNTVRFSNLTVVLKRVQTIKVININGSVAFLRYCQ